MLDAKQLQFVLAEFQGTNNYFKNMLGLRYTDGIKFLADNAECYWLIDAIASYQKTALNNPNLAEFQLWILVVGNNHEFIKPNPENDAVLTCWEDTPGCCDKPAIAQQIPFTDFPLPSIELYVEGGVLMLPSER